MNIQALHYHSSAALVLAVALGLISCASDDDQAETVLSDVAIDPAVMLLDSVPVFMQRADVPGR